MSGTSRSSGNTDSLQRPRESSSHFPFQLSSLPCEAEPRLQVTIISTEETFMILIAEYL